MPRRRWLLVLIALATAGCGGRLETSLQQLLESRRLSADLLVQFARVIDSGNRAVMADTDEASSAFVRETEHATQLVQQDIDALKPVLTGLGYSSEARLLENFKQQFSDFRALDSTILGLTVENSNLRAQRLSFGPAQEAADAFTEALDPIARSAPAQVPWRVAALAATAVAAVREIQALQAPHNAEAEDAVMTRLEARMMTAEAAARAALQQMAALVPPDSRPRLTAATAALDRFMSTNAEIVRLSRRNSNVRSLALSLGQKRTLTAECEETLRTLQDALEQRSLTSGTR
jgi:hypothetical protein